MKVSAFAIAAACSAIAAGPATAQTLRVGLQEEPATLDPASGGTYVGRIVFDAMCDKLVDINADLEIVPQLATEWSWNDDDTRLTMTLREDVTFHDGTPFNAEAVKANIERAQTMENSRRKSELSPISSTEVVDEYSVAFNLDEPFAPLLAVLSDRAGMMVSPQAAAEDGFATQPVCSGPFQFVDRQARDSITLEKYDEYWNADEIGYDEVRYLIIPDSTVRLQRLQAGDLEIGERMAPSDIPAIEAAGDLTLHSAPGLAVSHLFVSQSEDSGPLADDPRLRRALELSLDREVINGVAFSGQFTATNQMIPPTSTFHSDAHPMPERDVERARELIAEAGVDAPRVEITYENSLTDNRVAQIIQSMAGEAGFDVALNPLETSSAVESYLAGNFELYIGNWSGRVDPDPTLFTFFGSEGSQNLNGYVNTELDEVLIAARQELEPGAREEMYDEATAILLEDLPTIPLYHPTWFYAARSNVEGIEILPDGILRLTGVHPAEQ